MVNTLPALAGLSKWIDPRRQMLLGLASGIASGNNWGDALGTGFARAAQGRQYDDAYATAKKEEAQRQEQLNETIRAFQAAGRDDLVAAAKSGRMGEAWTAFLKKDVLADNMTAEQRNFMFAQENPDFMGFLTNKGGPAEMSLQPTWMQDEQGNWFIGQMTKDGRVVRSNVPEGMNVVPPADIAGARAAGTTLGKEVAGAQFSLPRAELTMQQSLQAIENIRAETAGMDEHFGNILGVPQQVTPAYPGSAKANFQVVAERAENRAFLEARDMLKGGGQITDFESRKAEAAITDMALAREKGDKAMYLRSLAEFEQAVKDGFAKLQQQAGMMPQVGGQQAPAGNTTSTGVQWSIEP